MRGMSYFNRRAVLDIFYIFITVDLGTLPVHLTVEISYTVAVYCYSQPQAACTSRGLSVCKEVEQNKYSWSNPGC